MCFIELLKRVDHNYNSLVDPKVYAWLDELLIYQHDCRGCRGKRELPWRVGDVSNGFDKATYDGPEGVNQSDTVSVPAVAPGQSIPTRVSQVLTTPPPAIRSPGDLPLAIWQTLYVNNQCLHVWNYVLWIVVPWRRRRDCLTFSIMFVTTSVIWWP